MEIKHAEMGLFFLKNVGVFTVLRLSLRHLFPTTFFYHLFFTENQHHRPRPDLAFVEAVFPEQ